MSDDLDEVEVEAEQENTGTPASVGLSVIRARDVPIAVVFRRGPTKHVRMIRWDMRRDDFVRGQWFVGRVNPWGCDLTPDGKYIDYAGEKRGDSFRAIAKPPYFTPLAVWTGVNGQPGGWKSTTDAALPTWLVPTLRLADLGRWQYADEQAAPFDVRMPHATITELELQRRMARSIAGFRPTDRHGYVYRLADTRNEIEHELGSADWADWHPSGDLVIARDGTIERIAIDHRTPGEPRVLADFTGETFEKMPPPREALVW